MQTARTESEFMEAGNLFISINESIRNGGISDELFFNSSFLKKLGKSLFDNVSFTNKKYDDETGRYDL